MNAKKKGKFIVLEGGEGSGKSSCIEYLKERLHLFHDKDQFIFTREPGGTPVGEKIRDILMSKDPDLKDMNILTELMLLCAARAEHVHKVITPAIKSGKHVICDCFDASTIAYQLDAPAKKEMRSNFDTLNALALGDVRILFNQWHGGTHPDMYIILDIDIETGLARTAKAKGKDMTRFDEKDFMYHEHIRQSFLDFVKRHEECTCIIDASMTEQKVKESVYEIVLRICEPSLE